MQTDTAHFYVAYLQNVMKPFNYKINFIFKSLLSFKHEKSLGNQT